MSPSPGGGVARQHPALPSPLPSGTDRCHSGSSLQDVTCACRRAKALHPRQGAAIGLLGLCHRAGHNDDAHHSSTTPHPGAQTPHETVQKPTLTQEKLDRAPAWGQSTTHISSAQFKTDHKLDSSACFNISSNGSWMSMPSLSICPWKSLSQDIFHAVF